MKYLALTTVFALTLSACHTPILPPDKVSDTQPILSADKQRQSELLNQALNYYQQHDYTQALPLFIQAEQAGHLKAPRYLGLMYLHGEGVAQDDKRAFSYFQKASDKGDITSQYWLGYCYENGVGVTKDMAQAITWYQKSAQRGDHVSEPSIHALQRLGITSY